MMMHRVLALALAAGLAATATTAMAADFSKGSNAKEIGLVGEEKAMFSGKVVDILCELSGDCPANCGDGKRQLGIVRKADNVLVLVSKNSQFEFNGAVDDLLTYCNKAIDADGLLIGDDPGMKTKVYMIQFIREAGAVEWIRTTRWTKAWAERNPQAKGEGPWFRRDPHVGKQIEKSGYFGLGKDVDEKWLKENR
jgi:hypothetical protein